MNIWKSAVITVAAVAAIAVVYEVGYEKVVYGQQATLLPKTTIQLSKPLTGATVPNSRQLASRKRGGHNWGVLNAVKMSPQAEKAMQADMAPSEALRKQGQDLYEAGDLAGAEQTYLKALDAAPTFGGYMKPSEPLIARQLGQAYLKDGQYDQTIHWLGGSRKSLTTVGGGLDLDLALAYARKGDYKTAKSLYSDRSIQQYHFAGKDVLLSDLPGTDTPKALEASILLARGLDAYFEARKEDALDDFQAANQLAPNNAFIAYYCAELLSDKGHYTEAISLFQCAQKGRDPIFKEASNHLAGTQSALMWSKR